MADRSCISGSVVRSDSGGLNSEAIGVFSAFEKAKSHSRVIFRRPLSRRETVAAVVSILSAKSSPFTRRIFILSRIYSGGSSVGSVAGLTIFKGYGHSHLRRMAKMVIFCVDENFQYGNFRLWKRSGSGALNGRSALTKRGR